jgi:hypothetical protein
MQKTKLTLVDFTRIRLRKHLRTLVARRLHTIGDGAQSRSESCGAVPGSLVSLGQTWNRTGRQPLVCSPAMIQIGVE